MAFLICLRAFTQASQEFMLLVQTSLTSPLCQTHCQLLHYHNSLECQSNSVDMQILGVKIVMFYFVAFHSSQRVLNYYEIKTHANYNSSN